MPGGQDRLEILERGAAQVRVARVEGQRRDAHRLALQRQSQQIEDVLADGAIIVGRRASSRSTASRTAAATAPARDICRSVPGAPARSAGAPRGWTRASACTRPSRARLEPQDFSTRGSRRRTMSGVAGSSSASTSWPAARGPNAVSASTTCPRISLFARSGMSAPISSGSVGGARSTCRMRARSPERRSAIAATTGSSCGAAVPCARPHRPARGVSRRRRGRPCLRRP